MDVLIQEKTETVLPCCSMQQCSGAPPSGGAGGGGGEGGGGRGGSGGGRPVSRASGSGAQDGIRPQHGAAVALANAPAPHPFSLPPFRFRYLNEAQPKACQPA